MLKRIMFSWVVNIVGLWLSAQIFVGNITYDERVGALLVAAFIFGVVNALIRPLVVLLSLPAILLTLGLFMLAVNAAMLYVTSFLYPPFQVNKFGSAVGATIVVWLTNYLFTVILTRPKEEN